MSKTIRFDIESNSPQGTTFTGNRSPKLAGSSNTKRKANFGINSTEPQGTTFTGNKSHISIPHANKAPKEVKTLSESSGTYKPAKVGGRDFGGSVGVGKSSPK
jgi:hypothetical protein